MRDFTTVRKAVEAAYGLRCAIDEGLGHSSRQEGDHGLDARADDQGRDEAMTWANWHEERSVAGNVCIDMVRDRRSANRLRTSAHAGRVR